MHALATREGHIPRAMCSRGPDATSLAGAPIDRAFNQAAPLGSTLVEGDIDAFVASPAAFACLRLIVRRSCNHPFSPNGSFRFAALPPWAVRPRRTSGDLRTTPANWPPVILHGAILRRRPRCLGHRCLTISGTSVALQ
ncbi:hypothetical protein MRX96_018562 [Rhipicephalus microplus]